jgi:hypothetical protein
VEESPDVGLLIVVTPAAHNGIDLFDQLLRCQRCPPPSPPAALTEATVEQVRREMRGVRQANDWDETATDCSQTGKL